MKYHHLFWDLDHTLWDFERNSQLALKELFEEQQLGQKLGIDFSEFHSTYKRYNEWLWEKYRHGLVTKADLRINRFLNTLKHYHYEDRSLAKWMEEEYLKRSPFMPHLMPGALEVLDYARSKYEMHIITNGFEEVQHIKMEKSGLGPYFREIITSESVGVRKPDPYIFKYSMRKTGAEPQNSLMIGDNWDADILGAKNSGMDQVFFNPEKKKKSDEPTFEIQSLREILDRNII